MKQMFVLPVEDGQQLEGADERDVEEICKSRRVEKRVSGQN